MIQYLYTRFKYTLLKFRGLFYSNYIHTVIIIEMTESMKRWEKKVAIVTGASAGIGAAIVRQLAENGVIVAGFARRKERVDAIAKEVNQKVSGNIYGVKVDLTKEEDILAGFKWVIDNLGPISILVNNAGVIQNTTLYAGETEKWRKILQTNVLALSICTREAIQNMRQNNIDGHIVHINSIVGHKVPTGSPNNMYPASKHAVTALTESLRYELVALGSKIKISGVSPGLVKTDIFEANKTEIVGISLDSMPSLLPEDIANAVIYILSTPPRVQIHDLMIKPTGEPY